MSTRVLRPRRAVGLAAVLVIAACSSGSRSGTAPSTAAKTTVQSPTTPAPHAGPARPGNSVGENAFLAGYPLVVTERTMQTFARLAGVNRLLRVPRLSSITSRFVVAPNHDTLYALAIIDLRGEAQALTVPAISRYYTFQFIDAWMDTVANVGTRATAGRPGTWVVIPPGYRGTLPAGVNVIRSPTDQLIVLGRIRAVDDADAGPAFAATAGVQLRPVSALAGEPAAPPPPAMPPPAGTPQTVGANGLAYFDELGDALAVNPPVDAQQAAAIRAAASLGVGAGKHPAHSATAAQRTILAKAITAGNSAVADTAGVGGRTIDGWDVNLHLGDPGTHPSLRTEAIIAKHYWGPNVASESVYPVARTASDGQPLTGTKNYVIHLAAANLPPVRAFWSYTVYGDDSFFVANAINRYNISGDTPGLVRNADGSIDIYLSPEPPAGHEANWLPTPDGPFRLVMRLYLPGPAVLAGTYRYPAVVVARS